MKKLLAIALLAAASADARPQEKKQVICTLPVLGAIAREVGGGDFDYASLSKSNQDPHFVAPTPSLMVRLRDADLLIEVGLQLELSWIDEVANGSGNSRVMKGAAGRIVASSGIPREEIPPVLSRSEGDIHPDGNPHVWLDPIRAKDIAANIAAGLKRIAPERAEAIDARLEAFARKIDEALFGEALVKKAGSAVLNRKALDGSLHEWLERRGLSDQLGGWMKRALPAKGSPVVEYHRSWVYFAKLFGLRIVGSVEKKPGIPPGPQHVEALRETIRAAKVSMILVDVFYDDSIPRRLSEETGARTVILEPQPQEGRSYFEFVGALVDRMTEGAGK